MIRFADSLQESSSCERAKLEISLVIPLGGDPLTSLWSPAVSTHFPKLDSAGALLQMQEVKTPVESAIESAKQTCDDGTTQECAAAWDEVRPYP